MMSLKPTSTVTALIVKVLLVFAIIDRVFSDNKVERCTRAINHLYLHRTATLYGMEAVVLTEYDQNIKKDPVKMFEKGFFALTETEIHKINIHFPDIYPTTSDPEELKEKIGEMLEQNAAFIKHLPRRSEFKGELQTTHEIFVARYESTSDPIELQKLFIDIEMYSASREGNRSYYPEEINDVIGEIDSYTFGYFKEFLNWVIIDDKDELKNTAKFCNKKHPRDHTAVDLCIDTIKQKFKFDDSLSGSEIFDQFYLIWTEKEVKKIFALKEEKDKMHEDLTFYWENNPKRGKEMMKGVNMIHKLQIDSLTSFYQQFTDKVKIANASQMPTPEDYCERFISGSSSSDIIIS